MSYPPCPLDPLLSLPATSQGVDLLVATPGRLVEHLQEGHLSLDRCRALVLDEVDVLLGAGGEGGSMGVLLGARGGGGEIGRAHV